MSDDHPLMCRFKKKMTLVQNLQLLKEVLLVSDEDVKVMPIVVDQHGCLLFWTRGHH